MWSPQTMGVDPLQAGRGSFQEMFSVVVQWTGRSFSPLTLLAAGPRHWGQFSANAAAKKKRRRAGMAAGFISKKDTTPRAAFRAAERARPFVPRSATPPVPPPARRGEAARAKDWANGRRAEGMRGG